MISFIMLYYIMIKFIIINFIIISFIMKKKVPRQSSWNFLFILQLYSVAATILRLSLCFCLTDA